MTTGELLLDELEEPDPEEFEELEPEELEPDVLEVEELESDKLDVDAPELEDPLLLCPAELLSELPDPLVDVPEVVLDCWVSPVDVLDFPVDREEVPVLELLAGAPLPSVRVSVQSRWESTEMLSLRVPALITRALTADVLNVALTPSQVATMESPLLERATLMVLVSPAVPVTVRMPLARAGVTLSMIRDSSISSPWKCLVGLTNRGRHSLDETREPPKTWFQKKVRNLLVRFARAIISPYAREKKL